MHFPVDWTLTLIRNVYREKQPLILYVSSEFYYFKVLLPNVTSTLYYSPSLRLISTRSFIASPLLRLYFKELMSTFLLFSRVWFRKLKIRGKGYYIYKNIRNTVTHQFGHSHRIYIYLFSISIKFLSKTQIFLFGTSKKDVFTAGLSIRSSKPLNIFTSRGVRFSKQIIYKKVGKVSSYR